MRTRDIYTCDKPQSINICTFIKCMGIWFHSEQTEVCNIPYIYNSMSIFPQKFAISSTMIIN